MKLRIAAGLLCCTATAAFAGSVDDNWPQWRGPHLDGTSASAHDLPTQWSPEANIVWKTPLPSWSAATPIVWDDIVFVTSAEKGFAGHKGSGEGGEQGRDKLLLLAVNRSDGSVRWRRVMGAGNRIGNKQNMTSPSPVTDGNRVWTTTGNGIVTAWDFTGKQVWQRDLEADFGKFGLQFGYASSPLLLEGRLYLQMLHGFHTDEPSYLLALDGATGRTVWRRDRPTDAIHESPDSYSTPTLATVDGTPQLIVAGGDYVTGHRLDDGHELWRRGGLNPLRARNYRTIASALVVDSMAFVPSRRKPFLAFRLSSAPEQVWATDYGPDVPTPTSDGEQLYIVDDKGIALSLRVSDGTVVWDRTRIEPGIYSASPLLADGKVYLVSEEGVATVLKAGAEYEVMGVNQLDGYTLASPAAAGNQIFFRTSQSLYCIGRTD